MKKKQKVSRMWINILFIMGCMIFIIPFYLALINSLKTAPEAQSLNLALPAEFHFENYKTVFEEGKLMRAILNGLLYSVVGVGATLFLCSLTAYIIARRNDKLSRFLNSYFMLGIIIPTSIIATFLVLKATHLIGTYTGLILIYIANSIPMAIFLYRGFIVSIPKELDEAAFIDGAGLIRTFFSIIFPTLKPITATVFVFTFMNIWNDFTVQLYYGSQKMRAMPLSVYNFFGIYSQSWNLVFADVIMTMVPVLLVYFLGQKYIISGMTQGAVKG